MKSASITLECPAILTWQLTRGEEGDDLRNDEGEYPRSQQDTTPRCPSNNRMLLQVLRVLESSEEDESSRDGGVQAANEDDGWYHERIGDLRELSWKTLECRAKGILFCKALQVYQMPV